VISPAPGARAQHRRYARQSQFAAWPL